MTSETLTIGGTPPITFAMFDELSEATIAAVVRGDAPVVERGSPPR